MAPKVRSMKIKKKIRGGSRSTSGSGTSSVIVEPSTTDSKKPGSLPREAGVKSSGSEIEPSPPKDNPAPSEQGRTNSLGSRTQEEYKQLAEYLATVAKVIEGICNKSDLLGDQSTEMVDGLLEATRELLSKALKKKQEELVIEPARASLTEKPTYAAIAAKEVRPPARVIPPEGGKEKETASAVKSLTWRVRTPIEKRIKKIGEVPEGSPLKKKLGGTQFVYFHGIIKQRIREVRKALSVLKVDTKEVKDISFVGNQVCAMLTTSAYAPVLIKKIVFKGSTITHLEDFDPLSSDNLKRAKGALDKLPEDLLIKRAAYATAQSDNLLVAMKYKELVPVARQGQFEEKVREVSKKLNEARKRKMAKGKPRRRRKKPTFGSSEEPQAMETDGSITR